TLVCPSAPNGRAGQAVCDYSTATVFGEPALWLIPPAPDGTHPNRLASGFWVRPVGITRPETDTPRATDITDGLSQTFLLFECSGRPDMFGSSPYSTFVPGFEMWACPASSIGISTVC